MLSTYQLVAGQFRAAQQSALQAQVYLPWYPSALNNLGIASLVLGEKSEAHHWFALSLEVAPDQQSIRGPLRRFVQARAESDRDQPAQQGLFGIRPLTA